MRKKITGISNDITTNEITADEITTGEITTDSHFHAGEQAIQTRLGVRDSMERFGRQVITNYMPEQHREFYQQLPFILLGHADKDGWPWATMLFNDATYKNSDSSTSVLATSGFSTSGFISSSNNKTLTINSKLINCLMLQTRQLPLERNCFVRYYSYEYRSTADSILAAALPKSSGNITG